MRKSIAALIASLIMLSFGAGCSKASTHADELHSTHEREMTLGIVRKRSVRGCLKEMSRKL